MKIVINRCYGGFALSPLAIRSYLKLKCLPFKEDATGFYLADDDNFVSFCHLDIPRDDPDLVFLVRLFGEDAEGRGALLRVVEIPDDVNWEITEHDGMEHIAERHRIWL